MNQQKHNYITFKSESRFFFKSYAIILASQHVFLLFHSPVIPSPFVLKLTEMIRQPIDEPKQTKFSKKRHLSS